MTKPHKYLSLVGASHTRMLHAKDTRLPQVEEMKNLLPGGDGCPSLRQDFTYETDRLMSCINVGAGGLQATDDDEHMVGIFEARNGQKAWFSRHFAFQTASGTATAKNSTYTTGTLSTTGSTVTGSGTAWLQNAWPGCLLLIAGNTKLYRIATVTADTTMTTDVAVGTTAGGTSYTLYQVHNGNDADYPINCAQWGDRIIYNVESPEPPVVEADVSGPFSNQITQGSMYIDWVLAKWARVNSRVDLANSKYIVSDSGTIYYATDPEGTWSAGSGWSAHTLRRAIYDSDSTHLVAIGHPASGGNTGVFEDSDGTGGTWTARTTTYEGTYGIAADGIGNFVVVNRNIVDAVGYSSDLTGAWTYVAYAATVKGPWWDVYWDGTNFIAVGDDGKVSTSANSSTWTQRTSGTTEDLHSATDDGSTVVAVGDNSIVIYSDDSGATWAIATVPDENVYLRSVRHSGSVFVAAGYTSDGGSFTGKCYQSTDGITWTELGLGEIGPYSQVLDAIPSDSGLSNLLLLLDRGTLTGNQNVLYYGDEYSSATTEFGTFSPLSLEYRARAFTVAGTYLMLACLREWDTGTSSWVYYPRRVRWPAPGTVADFEGEGSGFIDCPGVGEILMLATSGYSAVGFDTNGVFALEQLGDLDVPWGYRRLKDGVTAVSNIVNIGSAIYWVGHDGRIWTSNGVQVEAIGGFDLSEFEEWVLGESKPVHLAWYPGLNALLVFRRTDSGTDHRVWTITEDQRVGYMSLPVWTDSGAAETRRPLSMFCSEDSDPTLHVGYDADTASDTNHLVTLSLNKGQFIRGRDVISASKTSRWFGRLQTGYERLTDEGDLVKIGSAELYGWTGYTDRTKSSETTSLAPHIGIQCKTQDGSSWLSTGSTAGTITVTTTTFTGSGTTFSNLIAAGDDVSTVFTLPCLATQARVYLDSTLTTAYSITGTRQITLTNPLPTGTDLYVYWDAEPLVRYEVGDLILTTSEAHRILTLTTATAGTLDPYITSGSDTGTHVPAERMDDGDGSTVHGIQQRGDDIQLRLTMVPQNNAASPSMVSLTGLTLTYQPLEAQEKRKD